MLAPRRGRTAGGISMVSGVTEAEVSLDEGTAAAAVGAPAALAQLIERFDPAVMDIPTGSARIRLSVGDRERWDAVISDQQIELLTADGDYDAELSADAQTWEQIATDLRGGMTAFQRGWLRVRRNLHLGVGFLAAT